MRSTTHICLMQKNQMNSVHLVAWINKDSSLTSIVWVNPNKFCASNYFSSLLYVVWVHYWKCIWDMKLPLWCIGCQPLLTPGNLVPHSIISHRFCSLRKTIHNTVFSDYVNHPMEHQQLWHRWTSDCLRNCYSRHRLRHTKHSMVCIVYTHSLTHLLVQHPPQTAPRQPTHSIVFDFNWAPLWYVI